MKKATKAALWSGLALPGAGQCVLKHYWRGMMFMVPFVVAIVLFIRDLQSKISFIMDKIMNGTIAPDVGTITAMLESMPETKIADIAQWVILIFWIGGIIDAYLLGKCMDNDADKRVDNAPQAK